MYGSSPIMIRLTSVLLVTSLVWGCSLHQPEPVQPPPDLPAKFSRWQGSAGEQQHSAPWWQDFADPQLNRLIEVLLAENLSLEQGLARLEQARATARQAGAGQWPSLTLSGEAGRSRQPGATGPSTGDTRQLAVAAAFEIDLWGKLAARSKAAEHSTQANFAELQTLTLGLVSQLIDLYYLAVEQRAQIRLVDQTIASFSETQNRVEHRYRLGVRPAIDVYQARQSLQNARAGRELFEAGLANAEHAMAVLIGRYPDRTSTGKLATLPALETSFPVGLPSQLLEQRPDLQTAMARIAAADQNVAAAIADRFPSINLLATYGRSRQELASGVLSGDFWSLVSGLTLPIFDAGRRQAEVERNQAVLREAVAAYRLAVLNAFREVEDGLANHQASNLRIRSLEETETATAATMRLAWQNYLQGLSDYLPVLTAQRAHYDTQSHLLAARRQLISHRISLARALGGNWMVTEI
ncbi:MAG: hypothetical protein C0614_08850 [Desulfuromonas sp.]|nr:MAG: hypothetical protein C0614_08850 [Desulfuromonas sp.]